MTYELLVSTMHQEDDSLLERMHIQSDAIIINQCDRMDYREVAWEGNRIRVFSFAERGVGLSRNTAWMRSTADIIEFADDDMIFADGYRERVLREFEVHPEADAIIFSINSLNPNRPSHKIEAYKRVGRVDARKYGGARLAVRRERLVHSNVCFSLLFGGGAPYGAGEDTLFIKSMMDAGMKIYKSPVFVADVKQSDSTWYSGRNDKFYFDKGALMAAMYPRLCRMGALVMAAAHAGPHPKEFFRVHRQYSRGIRSFKNRIKE